VLECVAVCCSVLQCVAVCWSVLECVAVTCSVLQCALECVAVFAVPSKRRQYHPSLSDGGTMYDHDPVCMYACLFVCMYVGMFVRVYACRCTTHTRLQISHARISHIQISSYGVATISRLLKSIRLFCRISSLS